MSKHIRDHKLFVIHQHQPSLSVAHLSALLWIAKGVSNWQSPLLSPASIALRLELPENHKKNQVGSASSKTFLTFWEFEHPKSESVAALRLKPEVLSKAALFKTNGFRRGAALSLFFLSFEGLRRRAVRGQERRG